MSVPDSSPPASTKAARHQLLPAEVRAKSVTVFGAVGATLLLGVAYDAYRLLTTTPDNPSFWRLAGARWCYLAFALVLVAPAIYGYWRRGWTTYSVEDGFIVKRIPFGGEARQAVSDISSIAIEELPKGSPALVIRPGPGNSEIGPYCRLARGYSNLGVLGLLDDLDHTPARDVFEERAREFLDLYREGVDVTLKCHESASPRVAEAYKHLAEGHLRRAERAFAKAEQDGASLPPAAGRLVQLVNAVGFESDQCSPSVR